MRHLRGGRARARRDDGQMMASMVIFCGILILAMLVVALVPVGQATNERSRAQTAADAAALAGADEARTQFARYSTKPGPLLLFFPGPATLVPPIEPLTGYGEASRYADDNGSQLLAPYSLNLASGEVRTHVRSLQDSTSEQYAEVGAAEARATAKMDVSFLCTWIGIPPVTGYFGTNPAAPPYFDATLKCGTWSAEYVVENIPTYPTFTYDTNPSDIYDALEPRLVD